MALLTTIPRMKPAVRCWSCCRALAMFAGILSCIEAQAAPVDPSMEYQVKAVFLFNFAQFVEWPPEAFPGPEAPLVIGVLGSDPFGPILDETVRNETVGGRPLTVRRFERVDEVVGCHILYISTSEARRLDDVVEHLRGRGVLTVSDSERFMVRGVMIRLVNDRNRIRLRINLDAAKDAGLEISSKLLRSAEVITSGGE